MVRIDRSQLSRAKYGQEKEYSGLKDMKTWKWTWKWNPRRIRMKLGSKTPGMIGAHRNQAVKIFLNKDVTSGDVKDVTSGDARMVHKKKRPPQVCLLKKKRQGGQLMNNNIHNISCHLGWLFDDSSNDQSCWFSRISLPALLRLQQSQGEGLRFQSWFWITCIFAEDTGDSHLNILL